MLIIRHLDEIPASVRGGALTIGNFDGVHRGHARILKQLQQQASNVGGPSVVFTFDPHPVRLLRPDQAPPPLTWTQRKAELIDELGVDALVVYATDRELLELTPQDFFIRIVQKRLRAKAMVEGPNFYFGHNREGTVTLLGELCRDAGIPLEVVEPLKDGDQFISSSRVRDLILSGDVDRACELLTNPYRIRGMITHGAARGAQIGFPTANMDAIDTLLPALGVYAGRAFVGDTVWPAAVNVGPNPTFGENALKIEAHLIGFEGTLYGQPLEVDFVARLRDIRPFGSVDALKQQLAADVEQTRRVVSNYRKSTGIS